MTDHAAVPSSASLVPVQRFSGAPPSAVSFRAPESRHGAVALSTAVTVLWALAVFGSTQIQVDRYVHHLAIVLHLLSLTFGFGSVLAVDLCGLAGLRRRRDFALADAVRTAAVVDMLIWVGYLGLILSGLLLRPDLHSPLMWVKLGAALLAGLNGVNARRVMAAMSALPRSARLADLPRPFARRAVAAALVSQAAWWTAILIGFFG